MKNRYQLSKKQHIHAKKSIRRFAADDGCIDVLRFNENLEHRIRLHYKNDIFTVFQLWDHGAEMKMSWIEKRFQPVVKKIMLQKSTLNLSLQEHRALTEYFCLWCARGQIYTENKSDGYITQNGVNPENITTDQQELLESRGVIYCIEDGVPARLLQGLRIRQLIDKQMYEMSRFFGVEDIKWGLISNEELQFFCADFYKTEPIFPISPHHCLLPNERDRIADKNYVQFINKLTREQAHKYIFGRNIFTDSKP